MNPEGRKIELIKKIAGVKSHPTRINSGEYQEVFKIGKYVVKRLMEDKVPKTENSEPLDKRLKTHLNFLYEHFPGLYAKPRVFIGEANTDSGSVNAIYQVEENINTFKNPETGKFGVMYGLPDLDKLFELARKHPSLEKDLYTLFNGWRELQKMGLDLDVSQLDNCCLYLNKTSTGNEVRLRIFDAVPIFIRSKTRLSLTDKIDSTTKANLIIQERSERGYESDFYIALFNYFDSN